MLTRIFCIFLAAAVTVVTVPPPPAEAQFGIRRVFKKVVRAPARIITAPLRVLPRAGGVFRSAFGVVAAVAVGAVIFNRLPRGERREVARRSKVVVAQDPDQRVADTFTSKDGKRQVTIVAEPMQTAADLRNDPAILVASDTVIAPPVKNDGPPSASSEAKVATDTATDAGPKTAPPADTKKPDLPAVKPVADADLVRMSEIPPDTQCRKVTTELEIRKKKGQETADQKDANTAIFCQTAPGEWKPAQA